jgi:hypothetical protein
MIRQVARVQDVRIAFACLRLSLPMTGRTAAFMFSLALLGLLCIDKDAKTVCQRENPHYVDTVRAFRDR